MMKLISVREQPQYKEQAIRYLQDSWSEVSPVIYENCITNCLDAEQPLPQWYLLEKDGAIIACAGLVPNDFISRMDLYPWLCALFVNEEHRGKGYGALLMEQAKQDTRKFGFRVLNLCTDLMGYYEKYGFRYIGQGYHPWDEDSRIYQIEV